jgi:hypothetical protein
LIAYVPISRPTNTPPLGRPFGAALAVVFAGFGALFAAAPSLATITFLP